MMKHIPNDLLIFYFTFANTKIHSYFLCAIMNKLKNKPFKNMGQIFKDSGRTQLWSIWFKQAPIQNFKT